MKKISLLCYNILTTGGTEKVVMSMANELAIRNFDVEIVYMREGNQQIPQDTNKKIKFKRLNFEKSSKCIKEIRHYINQNKPDAIISFGRHINNTLMLARLGLKTNTKFILTEHGNPKMAEQLAKGKIKKYKVKITNKLANSIYKYADNVIAVSNSLREVLEADMKNINIDSIYNPVINSEFYEKSLQNILESPYIEKKAPIIVNVGRLSDVKNHDLLIDAFKIVTDKKDVNLVLVGDGELEEYIKEKVNKLNLNNKVFMLGYKENPQAYIKNADLFVLSSKTEAFGLVLVEALALGTPIVSTDCQVGPREVLQDGKYGMLCKQNDVELAELIIKALDNNQLENINEKELEEYLKQFKVEYIVDKYLELI